MTNLINFFEIIFSIFEKLLYIFFNRTVLYFRSGNRGLLLKQHTEIYNNIINGNPDKAKKTMQEHINYAKKGIIELGEISEREKIAKQRLIKIRQKNKF